MGFIDDNKKSGTDLSLHLGKTRKRQAFIINVYNTILLRKNKKV